MNSEKVKNETYNNGNNGNDEKKEKKDRKGTIKRIVMAVIVIFIVLFCIIMLSDDGGVIRQITEQYHEDDDDEDKTNASIPVYMDEQMVTGSNCRITAANPNHNYYLQFTYLDGDKEIGKTKLVKPGDVQMVDLHVNLKPGETRPVKCVTSVIYKDKKTKSPQSAEQEFELYRIS